MSRAVCAGLAACLPHHRPWAYAPATPGCSFRALWRPPRMHSAHRQFVAPHPAQTTTAHHAWLGEVAAAPPSCSLQAAHCIDACQLTHRANPMIEVDCMSGRLCFYAFMQRAMLSAMLLCRELCCIALHSPWHSSGHNFGNIALSIALGIALCPALCSALCFMLNIALGITISHQCFNALRSYPNRMRCWES